MMFLKIMLILYINISIAILKSVFEIPIMLKIPKLVVARGKRLLYLYNNI